MAAAHKEAIRTVAAVLAARPEAAAAQEKRIRTAAAVPHGRPAVAAAQEEAIRTAAAVLAARREVVNRSVVAVAPRPCHARPRHARPRHAAAGQGMRVELLRRYLYLPTRDLAADLGAIL